MSFTPQKQQWNSPFDSEFSFDDQDQFDYNSSSPLLNIKSSSLKAIGHDSPPRTPIYRLKTRDRSFYSSPLGRSPKSGSKLRLEEEEKDSVEVLDELLQDLRFKERYLLVKEQAVKNSSIHYISLSRNGSRSSSRGSSPNPKATLMSSPVGQPLQESNRVDKEVEHMTKTQDRIVSSLEDRLNKRSSAVAAKIRAIEEEKRRKEEEKRRKEEEERRRVEEERRKVEEEERKRKEEEARKKGEEEKKAKEAEEKAKAEAEKLRKEKEEEAKRAKEEAEKKAKEEAASASRQGNGVTNYQDIEKQFLHYKQKIQDIKETIVLKVKSDLPTKNAILKHKRRINPKFGQLTNSMTQLQRISQEVSEMINETKSLDIAYQWILNFVAKAIVSQAETEVRVKPSSSLPLAKLTVYLLCSFPELKEFLLARFVKKCPFVIGYTCSIDTEEGRLRMGWKRHEDNKWEDEGTYDERMGGMMTLYSVISRIPLDQLHFNMEHPIPIGEGWKMVVRWLNLKPELLTNVHFIVAAAWWEASANEFLMNYGRQGHKLLQTIWTAWPQSVELKKLTGAKTLQTIGEDWIREGKVKAFDEMEP